MTNVELKLVSVECIKSSEKEADELYVTVESDLFGASEEKTLRFPSESPGYWNFKAGQKTNLDLTLFAGPIEGPSKFEIEFMEDDSSGLGAVPIFGRFLNKGIDEIVENEVGGIKVYVDSNEVTWRSGEDTLGTEGAEGSERTFTLRGAGANYSIVLACTVA